MTSPAMSHKHCRPLSGSLISQRWARLNDMSGHVCVQHPDDQHGTVFATALRPATSASGLLLDACLRDTWILGELQARAITLVYDFRVPPFVHRDQL